MARETALRIRIDLALSVDATDLSAFGQAVKKLDDLKSSIKDQGFTFTKDISSTVGSYDFGGDEGLEKFDGDNGSTEEPDVDTSPSSSETA